MSLKKLLVIILVLSLITATVSGCGNKSPKQRLLEAVEKSQQVNTNHVKGNIKLNLSFPKQEQESQNRQMAQMLKHLNITIEGRSQKEPALSIVDMTMGFNGMNFTIQMYMKDNEMWMKLPMIPSYLYIDAAAAAKQRGETLDLKKQQELNKKFNKKFAKKMINSIDENSLMMKKGITLENNVKADLITLNLKNEDFKNAITIMAEMLDSAEFKDLHKSMIFPSKKSQEYSSSQEIKNELAKALERFEKIIEVKNLELKLYVDKDSNIRRQGIKGRLAIKDEKDQNEMMMELDGIFDIDEINEKIEFDFPDFKKEQVVPMDSFMGGSQYPMFPRN